MSPKPARRTAQRGALMIEVLVALVLCAFSLLGFAALQTRATAVEFESLQRSQALVLVEDMASRLSANRGLADVYVTAGPVGAGDLQDCSAATGAELDLCEWANLIRGSVERRAGLAVGAMLAARGCITRAAGSSDRYVIAIAWHGHVPSAASASACGQGDAAFPDEALRRAVSSTVCIARLQDPALAPPTPRC
jgi:type IV pilus assembly protein PilV